VLCWIGIWHVGASSSRFKSISKTGFFPVCSCVKIMDVVEVKLRHYWNSCLKHCDCGCIERVWFANKWNCLSKLIEVVEENGFEVKKVKK